MQKLWMSVQEIASLVGTSDTAIYRALKRPKCTGAERINNEGVKGWKWNVLCPRFPVYYRRAVCKAKGLDYELIEAGYSADETPEKAEQTKLPGIRIVIDIRFEELQHGA